MRGHNFYSELRYKAWGETRFESGATPTMKQYTGQYAEPLLGFDYFKAMWYDHYINRWFQHHCRQGVLAASK